MASSRRSARSADPPLPRHGWEPAVAAVAGAFDRAPVRGQRCLVAFSGGLDSTVLLHAAVCALGAQALVAVHVHHGLQAAADPWPAHCDAVARGLGVAFECVRVAGAPPRGASLEAWAREQRYAALAAAAGRWGTDAVLIAHHADDQVETVLMRLARGTGLDGMAGMAPISLRGGLALVRPFLGLSRAELLRYAIERDLHWVEDPSNSDLRRTRNAIRHRLRSATDAESAGLRERLFALLPLVRAARRAQAAVAHEDLRRARVASGLDRRVLERLPAPRRRATLRAWLREQGLRMPTQARLLEIDKQLVGARGAYGRVQHEGVALVRYRDTIGVCDAAPPTPAAPLRVVLHWRTERSIDLPAGYGCLLFEPASPDVAGAISARWLRTQALTVSTGSASAERMRPRAGAHRRTLKNLYQEGGVPRWARPTLPLVHAAGRLLYAGGIGMDCDEGRPTDGACVTLRWQPSRRGDPRSPWCAPGGA